MTTTPTQPPTLSSVLSSDEQFAVFAALADRYVPIQQRRDRMRGYHGAGLGLLYLGLLCFGMGEDSYGTGAS